MKRKQIVPLAFLATSLGSFAQGLNVTANVGAVSSSAKNEKTTIGGFLGAGYEFGVGKNFYIGPQLRLNYEEFKQKGATTYGTFYSQYSTSLHALATYKIPVGEALALNINAGPYAQYAIFGRTHTSVKDGGKAPELGWWHSDFGGKFTYGITAGVGLEIGGKWRVMFDYKQALKKTDMTHGGNANALSVGVGYSF